MPGCPMPKGKGKQIKEAIMGQPANMPMKRRSPKKPEFMQQQEAQLMPDRDIMMMPDNYIQDSNTMY